MSDKQEFFLEKLKEISGEEKGENPNGQRWIPEIQRHPDWVTRTDGNGNTLLMVAAEKGWETVVETLINQGALLDQSDRLGHSALIKATEQGHMKVVKRLIEAGADLNVQCNKGSALTIAMLQNHEDIVKMLIQEGADLNVRTRSGTLPLIIAIRDRNQTVMKWLLEKDVDVDLKDSNGWNALFWACHGGWVESVEALLEKGANVNMQDDGGETALMVTAQSFYRKSDLKKVFQWLLNAGADDRLVMTMGLTVRDFIHGRQTNPVNPQEESLKKSLIKILNEHHARKEAQHLSNVINVLDQGPKDDEPKKQGQPVLRL